MNKKKIPAKKTFVHNLITSLWHSHNHCQLAVNWKSDRAFSPGIILEASFGSRPVFRPPKWIWTSPRPFRTDPFCTSYSVRHFAQSLSLFGILSKLTQMKETVLITKIHQWSTWFRWYASWFCEWIENRWYLCFQSLRSNHRSHWSVKPNATHVLNTHEVGCGSAVGLRWITFRAKNVIPYNAHNILIQTVTLHNKIKLEFWQCAACEKQIKNDHRLDSFHASLRKEEKVLFLFLEMYIWKKNTFAGIWQMKWNLFVCLFNV